MPPAKRKKQKTGRRAKFHSDGEEEEHRRIQVACGSCRSKKIRCSGDDPVCSNCLAHPNRRCEYLKVTPEQSEAAKARKKYTYESGSYSYRPGLEGYAYTKPVAPTPASTTSIVSSRRNSIASAASSLSSLDGSQAATASAGSELGEEQAVEQQTSLENNAVEGGPLESGTTTARAYYDPYEYETESIGTDEPTFTIPEGEQSSWDEPPPPSNIGDPGIPPIDAYYPAYVDLYAPVMLSSLSEPIPHVEPSTYSSQPIYDPRSTLASALLPYHDMIRSTSYDSHFVPDPVEPAYHPAVNHYHYRVPDPEPIVPVASTSTYIAPRIPQASMPYYPYHTVTPAKRPRNTGMPAWGSNTPGETH